MAGILNALNKANKFNVILGSIGATLAVAGIFHGMMLSQGTKVRTMQDDWVAATKEYMKFQQMNPIFGISSQKK